MDTIEWGLRCETARGSHWLAIGPLSEQQARAKASSYPRHPAAVIKAAPMPPHIAATLRTPALPLAA